ncbi:MAG TPA: hypothetical protein VGF79_10125 [Bacteroidia bacterium]
MKKHFFSKPLVWGLILLGLAACKSEEKRNQSVGFNGGFEAFDDGLPVNWIVYSNKTVKDNDFDVLKDSIDYAEGKSSLKFVVRTCSGKPGRFSPGFTNEFEAKVGATYKVSFKVKNKGCKWKMNVSGVNAFNGSEVKEIPGVDAALGWQSYECDYVMPEKMERLRLELNVLSAGELNIDDVKVDLKD